MPLVYNVLSWTSAIFCFIPYSQYMLWKSKPYVKLLCVGRLWSSVVYFSIYFVYYCDIYYTLPLIYFEYLCAPRTLDLEAVLQKYKYPETKYQISRLLNHSKLLYLSECLYTYINYNISMTIVILLMFTFLYCHRDFSIEG